MKRTPEEIAEARKIVAELPLIKHRLGELGLLKTMQAMEEPVTAAGYELAGWLEET